MMDILHVFLVQDFVFVYIYIFFLFLLKTLPVLPIAPVLEKNVFKALTQPPDKAADLSR